MFRKNQYLVMKLNNDLEVEAYTEKVYIILVLHEENLDADHPL